MKTFVLLLTFSLVSCAHSTKVANSSSSNKSWKERGLASQSSKNLYTDSKRLIRFNSSDDFNVLKKNIMKIVDGLMKNRNGKLASFVDKVNKRGAEMCGSRYTPAQDDKEPGFGYLAKETGSHYSTYPNYEDGRELQFWTERTFLVSYAPHCEKARMGSSPMEPVFFKVILGYYENGTGKKHKKDETVLEDDYVVVKLGDDIDLPTLYSR